MNPIGKLGQFALSLAALSMVNLTGCDLMTASNDLDASVPVAAQVMLLEVPYDNLGHAGENMPSSGTTITVSLMNGTEDYSEFQPGEMLPGATVNLWHPNLERDEVITIPAVENSPGVYALNNLQDERLQYLPGANFRVVVQLNGEEFEICQVVPDVTTYTDAPMFGEYVSGDENVRVSWAPSESNALVAVTNSAGELVHYSMPNTSDELYDWLAHRAAPSASIPGGVFEEKETYAIAVAALRQAEWGKEEAQLAFLSENLSPVGSFFLAGSAAVTAVSSEPLEFVEATIVQTGAGEAEGIRVDVMASEFDIRKYMDGTVEENPLTYETVWLEQPDGQKVLLEELIEGGTRTGTYVPADDARGLIYLPDEEYRINLEDSTGRVRYLTAKVSAKLGLEGAGDVQEMIAGQTLFLTWNHPAEQVALRVLTNSAQVVYETLVSGDGELLMGAEIPGEIFEDQPGTYQVEVLGLAGADGFGESYGLNLAYSDFVSGQDERMLLEVLAP